MKLKGLLADFRKSLVPHIRHLAGCRSLLASDAKNEANAELDAFLDTLDARTAMMESSLRYYTDETTERSENIRADDIRASLTSPILEIRGAAKDFLKTLQKSKQPYLSEDVGLIVSAADRILDLIEEQIVFIFFDPNDPNVPTMTKLETSEENEEESQLSAHRGTILIVDDTDMNRFLLSRHLGRQGHRVIEAKSGLEAITLLNDHRVDLVLLDVMMPGMNGYQVLEILKTDAKFRDIPVVMLSAFEDEKSIVRCIELGAEDYLSKSFNPVFLKARIESSLEKKHLHDQERYYLEALQESQTRLFNDLTEASQYVTSLLPPPIEDPVAIDWRFIPSAQLGGDSFGYHGLDDGKFAIYLLDVSGHGIGAALLAVSVVNMLRNQALQDADFSVPHSVLQSLNRKFRMEDQNNMFFTIWYGVYSPSEGTIRFSSAGSPPAVLLNEKTGQKDPIPLKTDGTAIGIRDDGIYETKEREIRAGDRLYLFSDGAFEIQDKEGEVMKLDSFIDLLAAATQKERETCRLDCILERLKDSGGGERFEDDLSLLEIRFPR